VNSEDELIRQLSVRYATAVDRNEPDKLTELFLPEAVIEGPGFRMNGLAEIRGIPGMLRKMYALTWHVIHQQRVTITGDQAESETHSTAHHLTEQGGGKATDLVWHLRYQDQLKRHEGAWRFAHRTLLVDWAETRDVSMTRN
jgi:hypothetical protein